MGDQYSDKANCLAALSKKQKDTEQQIELLYKERDSLVSQYKAQYIQQKSQLQSIPRLVKSLAKSIMENSNT